MRIFIIFISGAIFFIVSFAAFAGQNSPPTIGSVVLELDETYRQSIEKRFNTKISGQSQDIISEYEAKKLTCRVTVFDSPEDLLYIFERPPRVFLLSGSSEGNAFRQLVEINNKRCELIYDPKDTDKKTPKKIECLANISAKEVKFVERGMLLKCGAVARDRELASQPSFSQTWGVADHLYYFFFSQKEIGNSLEQLAGFLEKSDLVDHLDKLKDKTRRLAKSYFYNYVIKLEQEIANRGPENVSLHKIAREAGASFETGKDDKLILISSELLQAYGETRQKGKERASGFTFRRDYKIFLDTFLWKYGLAHEMGHASIWSGLCDEYEKDRWAASNVRNACPNPFPFCCDMGTCGSPSKCFGMPYYPDINTAQPEYDSKEYAIMPKYFSIMSPILATAGPGGFEIPKIYPVEANCPLRDCK